MIEKLQNSDTKQVTLPLKLYELHKDTYRTRHRPLFCYFTTTYILIHTQWSEFPKFVQQLWVLFAPFQPRIWIKYVKNVVLNTIFNQKRTFIGILNLSLSLVRNGILLPKLFHDLLWEKIVLVIEKNFWNSRLKAKNLQNFWDH